MYSQLSVYTYQPQILDALANHGLLPRPETPPDALRDAVRDLYKYEIRRLRGRLLDGDIQKRDYAGHVVMLRKRYWLLSIPTSLWTSST
jgi:hypothetical protein